MITQEAVDSFLSSTPLFCQDDHNLQILLASIKQSPDFFERPDALQLFVNHNRGVFHWLQTDEKPKAPKTPTNPDRWNALIDAGVTPSKFENLALRPAADAAAAQKRQAERAEWQVKQQREELRVKLDAVYGESIVNIKSGPMMGQVDHARTAEKRAAARAKIQAEIAAFNARNPNHKIEVD
jgi:hypothetical protein